MSLPHGLLGLLTYAPMSGYDLKKVFEESIHFFWSAQTSQIYRELKTLEKGGFVECATAPSRTGPDRKIYSITESGRQRLKEWLLHMPDDIGEDNRNEFLLRVFLSSAVGLDALHAMIRQRLDRYRRDMAKLEAIGEVVENYRGRFDVEAQLPYWNIAVMRGLHDVGSHIQWAEASLRILEERAGGTP